MSKIISIEPAIDPNARPTFLLDWEVTMKCNLDCSYCGPWGHNNSSQHPPLEECLKSIDFMYEYADLYMQYKPKWSRIVVLNVYGGESLFHPGIETILEQVRERHKKYQDRWPLTVTCTTNAVVGSNLMNKIIGHIDEFTVSYHVESLIKQKQQVIDNLIKIKNSGKRLKCVVLMHKDEKHWEELMEVIEFCKSNNIRYLPKQIDGSSDVTYSTKQVQWFRGVWQKNSSTKGKPIQENVLKDIDLTKPTVLNKTGRSCCGGRLLCTNGELDKPIYYVPGQDFKGWSCSVNWFFLFVRQLTGEVYVNKDCLMRFDGTVGPIGHINDGKTLIEQTRHWLETSTMPVITCAKDHCFCGLCAPKAQDKDTLIDQMKKHITSNVLC